MHPNDLKVNLDPACLFGVLQDTVLGPVFTVPTFLNEIWKYEIYEYNEMNCLSLKEDKRLFVFIT